MRDRRLTLRMRSVRLEEIMSNAFSTKLVTAGYTAAWSIMLAEVPT